MRESSQISAQNKKKVLPHPRPPFPTVKQNGRLNSERKINKPLNNSARKQFGAFATVSLEWHNGGVSLAGTRGLSVVLMLLFSFLLSRRFCSLSVAAFFRLYFLGPFGFCFWFSRLYCCLFPFFDYLQTCSNVRIRFTSPYLIVYTYLHLFISRNDLHINHF